jgi:putative nucleotidyltransferase with HDIG domain
MDSRESATAQHSFMVNKIAMAIGRKLRLPQKELLQLQWGTLLHDIGKLGISDAILMKPSRLSSEEYELIKKHPIVGYELVKNNDYLTTASQIILYHHERWEGGGYPMGLKREQIPVMARICCLADAVAAMAEDRPYRQAVTMEQIVEEIKRNSAIQFDPEIVVVFVAMQSKTEQIFDALELAMAQPGIS